MISVTFIANSEAVLLFGSKEKKLAINDFICLYPPDNTSNQQYCY